MSSSLDTLLSRLEEVSAEAIRATDLEEADLTTVAELLETRSSLIGELETRVAAEGPFSYTDFNRMLVIHVQGRRLEMQLEKRRQEWHRTLAAASQQRAYVACISGTLSAR